LIINQKVYYSYIISKQSKFFRFAIFKTVKLLKGRMHCFSMQIGINMCYLLNPGKKFGADPYCRFRKNAKNAHLFPKNDVTETKARLL